MHENVEKAIIVLDESISTLNDLISEELYNEARIYHMDAVLRAVHGVTLAMKEHNEYWTTSITT